MHEASLAFNLVELVQETLARHQLQRALVLHVEVGALAMVDAEALALAFASAKQGTSCAEAQLCLSSTPSQTICPACEAPVSVSYRSQPCPACNNLDGWPPSTNGLLLKTLEAE
jgi:hydrogenase nickel incorporation protein HypA/HybF